MASYSDKSPGVQGAHMRNPNEAPSTYISRTIPVIHKDSYILAAVSPPLMSDFYAFNCLFKDTGSAQKWITAVDPHALLKKYEAEGYGDALLHGNPYQDRKVVLSDDLMKKGQLTKPTVVKESEMVERFLKEAKEASDAAAKKDVPLILLVFCHGLETHELSLDSGKGLSALILRGYLEPRAQVTLITNACFSGGWAIDPDFNNPVTIAAGHRKQSHSGGLSDSMGRASGSVFVSSLVNTLISTASPLIEASAPSTPTRAGHEKERKISLPLQPESPTAQQTTTYNKFCHSVWDACKNITRLSSMHTFAYSARHENWDHSWTGSTGIQISHYEKRWNQLPVVEYKGSPEAKAQWDVDSSNQGSSSGNAPVAKSDGVNDTFNQKMIENMRNRQAQELARLFVTRTCPGDWTAGVNISYGGQLRRCADGKRPNKLSNPDSEEGWFDMMEVVASIKFRWEMCGLADLIAQKYELPMPNGQECLFWDRYVPKIEAVKGLPNFEHLDDIAHAALRDGGFIIHPRPEQGPMFARPWHYLSAAIAQWGQSEDKTKKLVSQILHFLQQFRESEEQMSMPAILNDPTILARGDDWLKSIGRRMRHRIARQSLDGAFQDLHISRTRSQSSRGALGDDDKGKRSLNEQRK
ncbi:hypothetical protein GGR57DRAFT_498182 [Xylariaceae sp. FL1272]|nr:hypothetical protein GGR57DRAFT_498182 [Xylariaceae sp. FL1272]